MYIIDRDDVYRASHTLLSGDRATIMLNCWLNYCYINLAIENMVLEYNMPRNEVSKLNILGDDDTI